MGNAGNAVPLPFNEARRFDPASFVLSFAATRSFILGFLLPFDGGRDGSDDAICGTGIGTDTGTEAGAGSFVVSISGKGK